MFSFFRKNTHNEAFVDSPMRDNWYQASSYYCSSFALITSVNEEGVTSIGPYQLTFPFEVINDRSFMVISRPTSNTVSNVHRTRKCALNFVEYDRKQIKTILDFGYPGQSPEEKMKDSCFTLVDSPTPGRESNDTHPKIIKEAFQVYECTWEEDREFEKFLKKSTSAHLVLRIENILLKETWKKNLENGGERMPRMPITYGFRGGCEVLVCGAQAGLLAADPHQQGPQVRGGPLRGQPHRRRDQVHAGSQQGTDGDSQALPAHRPQGHREGRKGARGHDHRPGLHSAAQQRAR